MNDTLTSTVLKWPDLGAENTVPLTREPVRRIHDESEGDYAARVAAWAALTSSTCAHCGKSSPPPDGLPRPERVAAETEAAFAERHKAWAEGLGRVKVVARLVDHDVAVGWRLELRAAHVREDARCAARGLPRPSRIAFVTAEGVRDHADACARVVREGLVRIEGLQVGARSLADMKLDELVPVLRRRAVLETVCLAVMAAQEVEGPEVLS